MKFSQKQNEFIKNANHRYNFKIGAVRSGKSYVDIAYTVPSRLRDVRNEDGLNFIIGVSKETIERNVLQPMREIYTDTIVGKINSRNIAMVCGVPVYCIGAAKSSQLAQIQGASVKYCYGDEIAKWNKEVFAMLQSRLDKPYSRFDGACNPEYPGHWLKEFIDRDDIDAYIQPYTIFDNPFLPQEFVDNLCKEYAGTVYYGRYIKGEWTLAEGLIYPMYNEADGEPQEDRPPDEYCLSIDYGTLNAFAVLLFARYGDIWYAIDEYYYSGRETGTQKTDEEYANDMDRWLDKYNFTYPLNAIIDPSAASFITLMNKRNHRYKAHKAINDVANGIRDTATALKKGLVKITEKCVNWHKEVQGYVWDESCVEDRPLKVDDHCMDAMRYFVETKRIIRKSIRSF